MNVARWTVPVSSWTYIAVNELQAVARPAFIEPMDWRRLSSLSKIALYGAAECCGDVIGAPGALRLVFASQHGELRRTTSILQSIAESDPVSPNAFSLSVLNAVTGIFGAARRDRAPVTAISAGRETLGHALLEAHAQLLETPLSPVLMIYAHEPAEAIYDQIGHDEERPHVMAMLMDQRRVEARLSCEMLVNEHAVQEAGSQSHALHTCLKSKVGARWHAASHVWQWGWHAA